ncbi:MAG: hypothetical protein ACLGI6_07455 [Gammaproteobacteria bacterium]
MPVTLLRLPHRLHAAAIAVALACALPAHAGADTRWVHGSWVNVRKGPASDAPVIAHLTTNTRVTLLTQSGPACSIRWGEAQEGHIACKLLGEQPLLYSDVANRLAADGKPNPRYSATRAFWMAPSMHALFEAGDHFYQTLLTEQQRQLEHSDPDTPPKLVRYPVAEFDAMKAVLAAGLVAPPDRDPPLISCATNQPAASTARPGTALPDAAYHYESETLFDTDLLVGCALPAAPKLTLPAIKRSLFTNTAELVAGGADVEQIGAHFGILEKGRVTAPPKWTRTEHEKFFSGVWDIGAYRLTLARPVVEHVIGRTGLVGAYQWTPQYDDSPKTPYQCGQGLLERHAGKQLIAGYPGIEDPLIAFQAPAALPIRRATIKARTIQLSRPRKHEHEQVTRVAVHEIDLNRDAVPDFVVWTLYSTGMIDADSEVEKLKQVFVNIDGQWYPLERSYEEECT